MSIEVSDNPRMGGMRNVWILSISMAVLAICYTMLVPFLPVYLFQLGVGSGDVEMWSGAVFSITFFVAGIMAPIWGKMADRKGKKLMLIRAAFFIGLTYILTGFVTNAWQLLLARAVMGFANGFMPAAMTLVSLSVKQEKAGTALGIFQTGLVVGNVVGPLLGGLVEAAIGMRPVFWVSGVILFIVTAVVAVMVKEPKLSISKEEKEKSDNTSFWQDVRDVRQKPVLVELLVLFFVMQCAIMMMQPIIALYVGSMQGTMDGAAIISGFILSAGGLAGVITTNLWARFGQRRGYFKIVSMALFGTGIALFLQSLPIGIWGFGILQLFVGCFIVGVNPSLSAAVTINTEEQVRGRVFGLATTTQQFGCMVGPVFASIVSTFVGIPFVYVITGLMLMAVGAQLYVRRGAKEQGNVIHTA
ncbi:MAG: MFS transporter [Veillonellaceae bacterium]|nr:MFS transporter [Veillonellaceae bacterium]